MNLREIERESIRDFLYRSTGLIEGAHLADFGCGSMPYRGLLFDLGATQYTPIDHEEYPGHVASTDPDWTIVTIPTALGIGPFDVVVSTQVIQYVPSPAGYVATVRNLLKPGGWALLTGPTNWPLVEEKTDLWRFTPAGIVALLSSDGGYAQVATGVRDSVPVFAGERWPTGWWACAQTRPEAA